MTQPAQSDVILVRVSQPILEKLANGDVEPVVMLGVKQNSDGTYDMTLKTPDVVAAQLRLAAALRLIRDTCPASAASGIAKAALEDAGIKDPEDDFPW